MKPAVGLVLTAIVLNCVGATTFSADFNSGESEDSSGNSAWETGSAGVTPTVDSKELLLNFSWEVLGSSETSNSDDCCNEICTTDYEPVCASDGVTYANYCAFSNAQCKTIDLTLLALGECAGGALSDEDETGSTASLCPDVCRDIYDPVSDENGTIYTNDCFMQMAQCNDTKKDVDIQAEYKKLYMRLFKALFHGDSTDDDSFSEESLSSSAVAITSTKSTTAGMLRTMETSSASDSDIGSLYEDESNDSIGSGSSSPTTKCINTCLDIYSPVCGSDGVSYINVCQLELAACKNPKLNIVRTNEDNCADSAPTTAQDEIVSEKKPFNATKTALMAATTTSVIFDPPAPDSMTRRAKERRTMRVQAKLQQLDENLMREKRLSSRASWIQLLSAIDGPYLSTNSSNLHVSSSDGLIKSPIVNELQWRSLQVPIAASGGFQLPIKLDARKGELFFSFSTRDYDVNFGVQMICADGSLIELLGTRRYESQKKQVQGQLSLTGPGMVLLLWDNSFSWVNTKQLAYHVELKQETLPVFAAGKTQLALKARLEREKKLMQYEGEYDRLETQVQTEERRVELLHHQIEELQTQLRKHEEAKENAIKKKDQVEEHIGDLFWELRALSWRCFDQTVLHRILDFLEEKDMAAWSLTSKKCYAHACAYQSNRRKSA